MKSKYTFRILFICTLIIVLSFYRVDSAVAMAAQQNTESAEEPETEPGGESAEEPETEPGGESIEEPETEPGGESIEEPETELGDESAKEPETEPETELGDESAKEPETEPGGEPTVEPKPGQEGETAAEQQAVQSVESVVWQKTEDRVSTGSALIEWLESHKNTGGTVKLADHVTLEGVHSICPTGVNMPPVFVDAGQYTITIAGEIELWSDGGFIFSGQPEGKGLFYVAENGILSIQGITVESGQCALWQEEGAGLVVSGCRISGSIHYAQKPFVVDQDSVCVVVEKGRTLDEVLPTQLVCTVNRQGENIHNEQMPIFWNLEGTEGQQEQRRRFQMEGSFLDAASVKPVSGTVVYNDYPLTFTNVDALGNGTWYIFRGGYTKPEETFPIKVISEYSFDAENWLVYEEMTVKDTYSGFSIVVESEETARAAHSNIYIRLQWDDNGTDYFSNVLCYASDNLECAEDIGGSRGGGTSIINPPDDPQESTGGTSSEENETAQETDQNADNEKPKTAADTDRVQKESSPDNLPVEGDTADTAHFEAGELNARSGQVADAESGNASVVQASGAALSNIRPELLKDAESSNIQPEPPSDAEPHIQPEPSSDTELANAQTKQPLYAESKAYHRETVNSSVSDARHVRDILIAAGLVLLAASAGIAGFCVHSQSGTNR